MKNIRILIVDDEQSVLNAVKNILQNYSVMCEKDALQAIKRVKDDYYHIIITDYQMPKCDGIKFLEAVKKEYMKNDYVGILTTASGTTYLFEDEYKHNLFSYFLEKPIDAGKLRNLIQKAISVLRLKKTYQTILD